ncbi:MAG: zf-HC2 domain-containing protein [Vicinamibacterales bacterium]
MTPHPNEELSGYLDGDLPPETRAQVDAHLADCAACRRVLDELAGVRAAAAAWADTLAEPGTDLWPGVVRHLAGPRAVVPGGSGIPVSASPTPWYRRRWSVGVPELAMAATVLAALGSALLWPRTAPQEPAAAAPAPVVAEIEWSGPAEAQVEPVSFADAQYNAAIQDLEQVLRKQRDRLDPRTVIVLERNLRVIDDAIREAREALASDPANALLNSHLASARRRKLDLLRRAALITEAN